MTLNPVFIVSEEYESQRLDFVLNAIVDFIPSRSFAAKLIDKRLVFVNGKTAKPSLRLKSDDELTVDVSFLDAPTEVPQAEHIPLDVIFEDEDLLVINKPAGLVVHPGAGVHSGTLVNAILAYCGATLPSLGGPARAGIVHRLDRDTSGVMVVAKTQRALTGLAVQFAAHAHGRVYRALTYKTLNPDEGRIETSHGRDPRNRLRYAVVAPGMGKRAALEYRTLETFGDGLASLVECELETGRTHQIRVQMTHLGCPLLGDSLYGQVPQKMRDKKDLWARVRPALGRQMLHAISLSFSHPVTQEQVSFHSPLPADFANVLDILRTA